MKPHHSGLPFLQAALYIILVQHWPYSLRKPRKVRRPTLLPPHHSCENGCAPPAGTGPIDRCSKDTHIGVILESGISTATAKPGDSVYFRTSFPITINNKVVIPVGSYLRGEVADSKRPGRVKGKGELRLPSEHVGVSQWLHCRYERRAAQRGWWSGENRFGRPDDRTRWQGQRRHHHRHNDRGGCGHRRDCGWRQRCWHWRGRRWCCRSRRGSAFSRPGRATSSRLFHGLVLERDLQLDADQIQLDFQRRPMHYPAP